MGLVHVNTIYPSPSPSSISSEERVENSIHSGLPNDAIKVPVPVKGFNTTINGEAPIVITQNNVQRTVVGVSQEANEESTTGTQMQRIDDKPVKNDDWIEVRKRTSKVPFALDVPVHNISVTI
jgi:hypothetical protein